MRNDTFPKKSEQFVIGDITTAGPGVAYIRRKRPGDIRGVIRNTGPAVLTATIKTSADNVTFADYAAGRFGGANQASVAIQPGGAAEFELPYNIGDVVRKYFAVYVSPLPGAAGILTINTEEGDFAVLRGAGADANLSPTD